MRLELEIYVQGFQPPDSINIRWSRQGPGAPHEAFLYPVSSHNPGQHAPSTGNTVRHHFSTRNTTKMVTWPAARAQGSSDGDYFHMGEIAVIAHDLGISDFAAGGGGGFNDANIVAGLQAIEGVLNEIELDTTTLVQLLDGTSHMSPFWEAGYTLAWMVFSGISHGEGPEGRTLYDLVRLLVDGEDEVEEWVEPDLSDFDAESELAQQGEPSSEIQPLNLTESLAPPSELEAPDDIEAGGQTQWTFTFGSHFGSEGPGTMSVTFDLMQLAGMVAPFGPVMILFAGMTGVSLVLAELKRR